MSYYRSVSVGLTGELMDALKKRAEDEGMNAARYVRALICDNLGMSNPDEERPVKASEPEEAEEEWSEETEDDSADDE